MFTDGYFFSISATRMVGGCEKWPISSVTDGRNPGNEGWSGREGQPPGPSGIEVRLTPAGEGGGGSGRMPACLAGAGGHVRGSHWTSNEQAFPPLGGGGHSARDCRRHERPLLDGTGEVLGSGTPMVSFSTLEMGGGPVVPQVPGVDKHRRGIRPAGAGRPLPQKTIVDLTKERENAAVRSLSVGAAEFSLRPGPRTRVTAGVDLDGGGDSPPSHLDSSVGRGNAAVPTAAQAGTVALSNFALTVCRGYCPVDFAGITVPAVAGMRFSAVAEVHSSAVDNDDAPSVVRANEQWSAVGLDPRTAPGIDNRPMKGISVLEPLEHWVLDVALDGRPMEGISVLEPLEHSNLEVALDGRPTEGISVLEPLEHSVLEVALDGRPTEGISVMEPLEHSVPDVALNRGNSLLVKIAVSDPLEHSV